MDYGATPSAESYHGDDWFNPRLDSSTGYHVHPDEFYTSETWTTEFPGAQGNFQVWNIHSFIYKKRGDAVTNQYLTAVQVEYFDGFEWKQYQEGAWLPTGAQESDPNEKENEIKFDPPIQKATMARVIVDHEHASNAYLSGRFDWVIAETSFEWGYANNLSLSASAIVLAAMTLM